MSLTARKSIVHLPQVVDLPNILGKDLSTREQVIINTFKDLNKGQNDGYTESIEIMSGNGRNMKVGTATIPQATADNYDFSPGFELPPTSVILNVGGEDRYRWDYHVQVGLLENANGFNFAARGLAKTLTAGDPAPVPGFEIRLSFNTGVPTVSAWDFCWLVLF